MYFCLNLTLSDEEKNILKNYKINNKIKYRSKQLHDIVMTPKNSFSADVIRQDWFPERNDKIFISHSHKDEELAIKLSCYIEEKLGISCFVDSYLWNDVKLLKNILTNSINKINRSPIVDDEESELLLHCNMILNTALQKQIDKCECIIFLNTSNSSEDNIGNTVHTYSPWIYSELFTTSIIRRKIPDNLQTKFNEEYIEHKGHINIEYSADISEYGHITLEEIDNYYSLKNSSNLFNDPIEYLSLYAKKDD